ncbi:MAG: FlgB family protein [Pseudooceanicola sp.]
MFKSLEVFQTASAMAAHAGKRQAVIARNIANADTPGFRANDIASFATVWKPGKEAMRATRSEHLHGVFANQMPRAVPTNGGNVSPNGNSVSLEEEMVKAADTDRQHQRALAIYRSALTVLRSSLGRR